MKRTNIKLASKCDHCDKKPLAKNLCSRHYAQVRKRGSVYNTYIDREPVAVDDTLEYRLPGGTVIVDKDFKHAGTVTMSTSGYAKIGNRYLHRLIMAAKDGEYIDHVNRNPLDNRRANLRLANANENSTNQKASVNNKTGVRGIYQSPYNGKYVAQVQFEKRKYHVGTFESLEEASKARDKVAKKVQGDFAALSGVV